MKNKISLINKFGILLVTVINFLFIFQKNFQITTENSFCGGTYLNQVNNSDFDLLSNKLTILSKSVLPEIFSFVKFQTTCIGLVNVDSITNNLIYYSNNFLFFIFYILLFSIFIKLFYNFAYIFQYRNLSYTILILTIFNSVGFDVKHLSYIFYSTFTFTFFVIIYKSFKEDFQISSKAYLFEFSLLYFLWIAVGINEMRLLMFEDNNFYHFSLWYTNYSQGFNRRGLIGTLLSYLGNFFDPRLILLILLFIIYALISYFLLKFFLIQDQNYISIILMLSPLFMSFYLFDLKGAFRKESLGILAFMYILNNLKFKKNFKTPVLIYYVALYSHPANIFLLPIIIFLLLKNNFKLKTISIVLLPVLIYIFAEIIFSSSVRLDSDIFCNEINSMPKIEINCSTIDKEYTGTVNADIFSFVYNTFEKTDSFELFYYLFSLILGLLPFFIDLKYIKKNLYLFLYLILFIPLFLLGYDWGRWIALYLILLTTFYINEPNKTHLKFSKINSFIFSIIYLYTWRVEHCCNITSTPLSISIFNSDSTPFLAFVRILFSEILKYVYI